MLGWTIYTHNPLAAHGSNSGLQMKGCSGAQGGLLRVTLDPFCWVWSGLVVCWQTIPPQNAVHREPQRRQSLRLQAPPEEDVPEKEAHQALLSPAAASPQLSPFWLVRQSYKVIGPAYSKHELKTRWTSGVHGENEPVTRVSSWHTMQLQVLNLLFPEVLEQRSSSPASHGARITLLYNLLVSIF